MSFTLCSLNLNGIRSAQKRGFSRWLERTRPDLLCLQELRAAPDQVDAGLRSPAGYNARWESAEKRGYAGVALYSRTPVDRYGVGTGLEWGDREGRALRGEIGPLTVQSVYIPSGSSSEERQEAKFAYLDHFFGYAQGLIETGAPIALCGDLNIAHTELDIHAPKRNAKNSGFLPEERRWFDQLLEQGWVDVLRQLHPDEPGLYSWWSNRGRAREKDLGWRIDYVLCSPPLAALAQEAWIEKKAGLSDHAPVWVRFADLEALQGRLGGEEKKPKRKAAKKAARKKA